MVVNLNPGFNPVAFSSDSFLQKTWDSLSEKITSIFTRNAPQNADNIESLNKWSFSKIIDKISNFFKTTFDSLDREYLPGQEAASH